MNTTNINTDISFYLRNFFVKGNTIHKYVKGSLQN